MREASAVVFNPPKSATLTQISNMMMPPKLGTHSPNGPAWHWIVTNDQLDGLRIDCLHCRVSGGELPSLSHLPVHRWLNASLARRLEADAQPAPP